jgi:hypothetical protein
MATNGSTARSAAVPCSGGFAGRPARSCSTRCRGGRPLLSVDGPGGRESVRRGSGLGLLDEPPLARLRPRQVSVGLLGLARSSVGASTARAPAPARARRRADRRGPRNRRRDDRPAGQDAPCGAGLPVRCLEPREGPPGRRGGRGLTYDDVGRSSTVAVQRRGRHDRLATPATGMQSISSTADPAAAVITGSASMVRALGRTSSTNTGPTLRIDHSRHPQ